MNYTYLNTPVGKLLIAGDSKGLKMISFAKGSTAIKPQKTWTKSESGLKEAIKQLSEYFAGKRRKFNLKLLPSGTQFQMDVLSALQTIPYGQTRSYTDIARAVGKPKAVRAVGGANHRNPLPIVIPCHRVIGANGDLTGFGGGLRTKQVLLELEKEYV